MKNLICPFCGKMPKETTKEVEKIGFVSMVKCDTNGCSMSLMDWMLKKDWNKRFAFSTYSKDYFVGDKIGVWCSKVSPGYGGIVVPMTIGPLENGQHFLIPPRKIDKDIYLPPMTYYRKISIKDVAVISLKEYKKLQNKNERK